MSEQYPIEDPHRVRSALTFFRVTAVIAGLALIVLVIEMVLKYALHNDVLSWWSPVHGLLFMGFVAATYNLGSKLRWPMGRMVGYVLTAFVPLLSFWLEQKVTREVREQLAGAAPAAR